MLPRRGISIQVHIATLFIGLGLMIGVSTTVLGYLQVKELSVDRKIRLVSPAKRSLSHAAKAFLELVKSS